MELGNGYTCVSLLVGLRMSAKMKTGTSLGTFIAAVIHNVHATCLMLRFAAMQDEVSDNRVLESSRQSRRACHMP